MPTRNINLTEHFDRFVQRQVSSGRYSNASEIVREALRLLEEQEQEREAKLRALRRAAKEGFDEIDQGKGIVLRGKKALDRFFNEIERDVAAKNMRNAGE
jgi:antitoxin ParD1/3/4